MLSTREWRLILLDQCHWVCKVVVGRGRGRSPLKATQTLHKLRDCANRQLLQAAKSSALAEDPLCIIDAADINGCFVGDAREEASPDAPMCCRPPLSTFRPATWHHLDTLELMGSSWLCIVHLSRYTYINNRYPLFLTYCGMRWSDDSLYSFCMHRGHFCEVTVPTDVFACK